MIVREHIPIANLFTCLWFNEVDRFTPRDQISFSTVRDKIRSKTNWTVNMFLDCERRNFVVQVTFRNSISLNSLQNSSFVSCSFRKFGYHVVCFLLFDIKHIYKPKNRQILDCEVQVISTKIFQYALRENAPSVLFHQSVCIKADLLIDIKQHFELECNYSNFWLVL